jgi:hypothetical protein
MKLSEYPPDELSWGMSDGARIPAGNESWEGIVELLTSANKAKTKNVLKISLTKLGRPANLGAELDNRENLFPIGIDL